MAKEPQELSPEEKLLKVIQKADADKKSGKPAAAVSPAATEPAASVKSAPQTMAEKTKPKLAQAGSGSAPVQKAGAAKPLAPPAEKPAVQPFRKPAKGLRKQATGAAKAVNFSLAAVAAFMLMLTGLQIRANTVLFRADLQTGGEAAADAGALTTASPTTPAVAKLLAAIETRPLFADLPDEKRPDPKQGPMRDWQSYLKDNLSMIGVSKISGTEDELEAILVDKKDGKMHFVKVGQKITLAQWDLKVEQVGGEETVLSDGTGKATVKSRTASGPELSR